MKSGRGQDALDTSSSCPSAQPDMAGAVVFGVVGGTADSPDVAYLEERQPVTPELLDLAGPVEPTEVFRFGAPCATSGCQHFDGARCSLAAKIVTLPPVVRRLPRCSLRPTCRWWREQGPRACARCPAVVTTDYAPTPALAEVADPAIAVAQLTTTRLEE